MEKTEKKGKGFKIAAIVVISFLTAITVFNIWWGLPVTFLSRVDAREVAYIEVRDGNNGKCFKVEEPEDISYIVNNIQERHFFRDAISLGYMGTWFTLEFYDGRGKQAEKLTINFYNTLRKDPFFYRDNGEGLCIDYLCDLEVELAGAWDQE